MTIVEVFIGSFINILCCKCMRNYKKKMRNLVIDQNTYKKVFSMITIAILIEPAYFSNGSFGFVDRIYDILKIILALFILFKFIFRMKTGANFWLVVLFEFCLLFSTLFMKGDLISFFNTNIYVIVMVMLLEWLLETNAPVIISSIGFVFGTYAHINLLTYLLFPQGLYIHEILGWNNCWFLGYKNLATPILLVGMVCTLYDSLMRKRKIDLYTISVIICSLWYQIGVLSITGIVSSILLIITTALSFYFDIIDKFLSCKKIILGNFILFFLIVFVRIQNIIDLFGNLILQLGRNITFSSRTYLWDRIIPLLHTSMWWGYGVQASDEYRSMFNYSWAFHLHSYYLQIFYEGGIIAFILLFGLLFSGGKHFDLFSQKKESVIIKCGILAYLVAIQMEVYAKISTMFILVFMLYHVGKIEEQYELLFHEYEMTRARKIQFMWGKSSLNKKKQKIISGASKELAEK